MLITVKLNKKWRFNLNEVKKKTFIKQRKFKKKIELCFKKVIVIFWNLTRYNYSYNYMFSRVLELQAVTWKCNGLQVIRYITFFTLHAWLKVCQVLSY